MIATPMPVDETERLAELRAMDILDTPPERRFDVITELARRMLGVEAAYISLVDADRQFYKSASSAAEEHADVPSCGGGEAEHERESPRNGFSFCAHCICRSDGLVVEDAALDPRFRDSPMVRNGEVRFYAGLPLRGPGGHKIGTFCIVDAEPKPFGEERFKTLKILAEMAEQQLQMVDVISAQRELLETKNQLVAAREREVQELRDAAEFVESMLPAKLNGGGPVHTDYEFIASSKLGGDLFGYHTLPDGSGRLAVYLLDVTGHGVSAALLSVSVFQSLRRQTLRDTDFADPARVLSALNCAYPMEEHGGKFFTMWYGVYDPQTRVIRYASGGHPPAIVVEPSGDTRALNQGGMIVGVMPDTPYSTSEAALAAGERLYLFSDGAFEVRQNGKGPLLMPDGLMPILAAASSDTTSRVRYIADAVRAYQGGDAFADDYSMLEFSVM